MVRDTLIAGLSLLLLGPALAGSAAAVDHPVTGTQLTLKRPANGPGALSLVLRDPVPVPAPDSADDPSLVGMTLTLFSRGSGERVDFSARAGRDLWKVRATPQTLTYTFTDRMAVAGSVDLHTAQLRTGAGVKLRARGARLDLDAPQGAVAVRLAWGSTRVCAIFDGEAVRQDTIGRFVARNADAAGLTDCSDETLTQVACGATAPQCNGECPAGRACQDLGGPSNPSCECVPVEGCPGGCPDGWICAYPSGGSPSCVPPFCSGGTGGSMCDGTCADPDTQCLSVLSLCLCMTPCSGGDVYPTCGGTCSDPGLTCRAAPDQCVCAP